MYNFHNYNKNFTYNVTENIQACNFIFVYTELFSHSLMSCVNGSEADR